MVSATLGISLLSNSLSRKDWQGDRKLSNDFHSVMSLFFIRKQELNTHFQKYCHSSSKPFSTIIPPRFVVPVLVLVRQSSCVTEKLADNTQISFYFIQWPSSKFREVAICRIIAMLQISAVWRRNQHWNANRSGKSYLGEMSPWRCSMVRVYEVGLSAICLSILKSGDSGRSW